MRMRLMEHLTLNDVSGFEAASAYMEEAAALGSRPGLERIRALCSFLGDPQDDLSFIHIAGTNGKGSTGVMIASALHACGLCTGMYYSPAVCGIKDHYMTDGAIISDEDYASAVSTVAAANKKLTESIGEGATQFELETAVAFLYFKSKNCDVVVLETGMGGTEDATNIVRNKICAVITSVSYDHMHYLGNTISEIASAKAGIITSDHPVIMLGSSPEVIEVVKNRCRETGSELYIADPVKIKMTHDLPAGEIIDYDKFANVRIPLSGRFQGENAVVALTVLDVIRKRGLIPKADISDNAIRTGLAEVIWPFRFERISEDPLVMIDGAHNADAARKLRQTIEERFDGYTIILVIGMFRDKEYDKVLGTLATIAGTVITTEAPGNPRALPAKDLAKAASIYCTDTVAAGSVSDAYDIAAAAYKTAGEKSVIIACGSFAYLAEFRKWAEVQAGSSGRKEW